MNRTLNGAFGFNPVIQEFRMSQGPTNLTALVNSAGDDRKFLSRASSPTAWSSVSLKVKKKLRLGAR
jgi:hypothetical protein